jgi:hypothetical protein
MTARSELIPEHVRVKCAYTCIQVFLFVWSSPNRVCAREDEDEKSCRLERWVDDVGQL